MTASISFQLKRWIKIREKDWNVLVNLIYSSFHHSFHVFLHWCSNAEGFAQDYQGACQLTKLKMALIFVKRLLHAKFACLSYFLSHKHTQHMHTLHSGKIHCIADNESTVILDPMQVLFLSVLKAMSLYFYQIFSQACNFPIGCHMSSKTQEWHLLLKEAKSTGTWYEMCDM